MTTPNMEQQGRQGDVAITKVNQIPQGIKIVKVIANLTEIVIAEGELTGHRHVMVAERPGSLTLHVADNGARYVTAESPTTIKHNTHGAWGVTQTLAPSIIETVIQREQTALDGVQQVKD